MFVGLREIRAAAGRFTLMGAVVGMITVLLVMLSGLTSGLGHQNTAVLEGFDADRIAVGSMLDDDAPEEVSFPQAGVTAEQVAGWSAVDGVDSAVPVGFTQTLLAGTDSGAGSAPVAVVGTPAGSGLMGRAVDAAGSSAGHHRDPRPGELMVSETVAEDTGLSAGDTVTVGQSELVVAETVTDQFYAHSPVVWVATEDWVQIAHAEAGPRPLVGTALAVIAEPGAQIDWEAAAADQHMLAVTTSESFAGLPAYASEQGSLLTMQGFLYGISALVIVAFVTVWTIQRTRELAVLRALGAAPGYLLRDSLGQAGLVLALGVIVGGGIGAGLGAVAATAVPFTLDAATVALPVIGVWVLGVLGSALAVRRVSRVDPMLALGGS